MEIGTISTDGAPEIKIEFEIKDNIDTQKIFHNNIPYECAIAWIDKTADGYIPALYPEVLIKKEKEKGPVFENEKDAEEWILRRLCK